MPRYNFLKNTFTYGEVSQRAEGRSDLEIFKGGCRRLENMFVKPIGGAYRRRGTEVVATLNPSATHLIPFQDRNILFVEGSSTLYFTENGFVTPTIVNLAGANANYSDPWSIHFAEISDTLEDHLWLVSAEKKPQRLVRSGTSFLTQYSLVPYDYSNITYNSNANLMLAWEDMNSTPATIFVTGGNPSLNQTIQSSNAGFAFVVGVYYQLHVLGYTIVAEVTTAGTGSALCKIHLGHVSGGGTPTATWWESAWNSKNGYPTAVTVHEGRVYMSRGSTFWASRLNSTYSFSHVEPSGGTTSDATGLKGTTQSRTPINWMSGGKSLVFGTSNGESIALGIDENKALTATNIKVRKESAYGSNGLQAKRIQDTLLFVGSDGLKVRELNFDFATDRYKAENLSALADHIPARHCPILSMGSEMGLRVWCYSEYPDQQLFALQNGSPAIYALTRDTSSKVAAWSRNLIAGADQVISISIPSRSNLSADVSLYAIVVRGSVKTLERIVLKDLLSTLDGSSADSAVATPTYYIDGAHGSFATTAPTTGTVFPGFDHLEGRTVSVWTNGVYVGEKVVTGGQVQTDLPYITIMAGLRFRSVVQTSPPDVGAVTGSALGNTARIDKARIKFYKTGAAAVGRDADHLEVLDFGTDLFTGIKSVDFNGDYEQEAMVWIETDEPAPMEISWIAMRGVLGEV